MSLAEDQLAADRAIRNSARAVFDARLSRLRSVLAQRSIPQRLADEAKSRAQSTAEEGVAIARESKWIVAATGAAILAWLFRGPLLASARRIFTRVREPEPASPWQRLQGWIMSKVKS